MRYVELNSFANFYVGLQISITSWMNNKSVYFERVFVLTLVYCFIKTLSERGVYFNTVSYCGSLIVVWRITGSSGSDNRACFSSDVYGLS